MSWVGSFNNFIRSAPTIRKFSNSTGGSIAGDLDTGCDKIVNSEGDNRARCELGGRRREMKEGMNVGSLVGSGGRGRAQAKVKREAEGSSNSGNTANNISTINGAAVPSVSSGVLSFNKNGISAAIIGSKNSNSLIEESVEVFDSDSFVIAASSDLEVNGKSGTNSLKESFKSASVVNDNYTTESDLQKDFLDKQAKANSAACMDSIIEESRGSRAHLQMPRIGMLMKS